jgi:hypothetical protein
MSASTTAESQVSTTTPSVPNFTDWGTEEQPTEEEERTAREDSLSKGNQTEIHWRAEYVEDKDRYRKLDNHNRDCHWEFRDEIDVSERVDRQFKRHKLFAIAAQLELTPLQRREAFARLFEIDLPEFGMRTDVVSFCLCAIVVRNDAERLGGDSPYHPSRNSENNEPTYARVESLLIEAPGRTDKSYIQKTWGKLAHGNPQLRDDDSWRTFVDSSSEVQQHPSHRADWAGKPTPRD